MKTKEIVIQFVGKHKITDAKTGREKLVPAIAPTNRTNGNLSIALPSDERQKKGFTHSHADFLLKNYGQEFKIKVSKGKEKGK